MSLLRCSGAAAPPSGTNNARWLPTHFMRFTAHIRVFSNTQRMSQSVTGAALLLAQERP